MSFFLLEMEGNKSLLSLLVFFFFVFGQETCFILILTDESMKLELLNKFLSSKFTLNSLLFLSRNKIEVCFGFLLVFSKDFFFWFSFIEKRLFVIDSERFFDLL